MMGGGGAAPPGVVVVVVVVVVAPNVIADVVGWRFDDDEHADDAMARNSNEAECIFLVGHCCLQKCTEIGSFSGLFVCTISGNNMVGQRCIDSYVDVQH